MGCEGPEDFDPDPPTSYPQDTTAQGRRADQGETDDWEDRILGMWNTVLERLTDQDLGRGGR